LDGFLHHRNAIWQAHLAVENGIFVLDMFQFQQRQELLAAPGRTGSAGCGFDGFRRHFDPVPNHSHSSRTASNPAKHGVA
jgi:hypothetical protein